MSRKKKKKARTRGSRSEIETTKKKTDNNRPEKKDFNKLKLFIASNADYIAVLAAAALAVVHLFFTDEYFLGSGTDLVSHEHPNHVFAMSWMARGILPLWNPFIFGGVPFQAGVHGYLYPGWWTGLVLPTGLDIKVGILLHLSFAALGSVWFARGRVKSRIASFIAGAVFALSAFTVMHLFAGHRVMVATASYLPWVAGACDRAANGKRSHLLLGIALTGLMMLAGHYQIIFIGMGGLLLFTLLDRLIGEQTQRIGQRSRAHAALKATLGWVLLLGGGALMAAVQLLPMFDAVGLSQRHGGSAEFAASFSSAPANLLSFVLPNLYGNKVEVPFVGAWSYWESLGYLGLGPLVLIVFGLASLPWRRYTPALIVLMGAVILTLGANTPIFDLYLTAIPGADLFRSPGRFTLLVILFGSLIAAMAMDVWLRDGIGKKRRAWSQAAAWPVLFGSLIAAVVLATHDIDSFKDWILEIGRSSRIKSLTDRQWSDLIEIGRADSMKASAISAAIGFALTLGIRRPSLTRILGIIVALILVADLYHFGRPFMKTAPKERFHMPARIAEIVRHENDPAIRLIPPAETRWQNFCAMNDIGNPGGYDTFIDNRYARYINRSQGHRLDKYFSFQKLRKGSPLIRHLGPSYLLTTMKFQNGRNRYMSGYNWFKPHKRIGRFSIYKDKDAPPRAALVHSAEIIEDEKETYRRMEGSDFDIRKTVLIEKELPKQFPNPEPQLPDAEERAEIKRYEPNRVEIEVKAASQAVLVLSDTFYPGWKATVDGKDTPMIHANRVMRALPIQKGEHKVVMTFLPKSFILGAIISFISILLLAVASVPFFAIFCPTDR